MLSTTKRITTPTRFALLALGAISFGCLTLPAMAGDAPDAGAKNPSTCRDLVNHKCLTKPNEGQSSQSQDTRNQDNAAAAARAGAAQAAGEIARAQAEAAADARSNAAYEANREKYGRDNGVFGPGAGWSVDKNGYYTPYNPFPNKGGVKTTAGKGGNGGAAGRTGSRTTDTRTSVTAAVPKNTATPTPTISTTYDKATNTTTRDHRTGATAAAGGPPPAAAIGSSSKATPEQLAAQSGTRDHRHK
jgi:hypothetical protein